MRPAISRGLELAKSALRSRLGKDASWLMFGLAARVLAQAFGFVFLARALGPADLGAFAAVLAIASVLSPIAEMGAYSLSVRDVVAGISVRKVTGTALALTSLLVPVSMIVLVAAASLAVPDVRWCQALAIGLGTFVGARLTSVFRGISVGRGELAFAAAIEASSGVAYAVAAVAAAALASSIETWAWLYCLQSLAVGTAGLLVLSARFGAPEIPRGGLRTRIREGSHFAVGTLAQSANTELDKALLARFSTLEDVGIYSASQRVVSVAIVPAMALFGAAYRRFFFTGPNAFEHSRRTAFRIAPLAAAYGAVAATLLFLGAPFASLVFGAQYRDATEVLRVLAPLVLIQACTYPFLDALTGAGYQHVRAAAQLCAVVIGVTLNVTLDKALGWRGAALASIASQLFLLAIAVICAPAIVRTLQRFRGTPDTLPRA
jgi:O-antigen/teichoic acid export membrane protein